MGDGYNKTLLEKVSTDNWDKEFDYFFVSKGSLGHFATPTNIKLFICEVVRKQLIALK